MFVFHVAVVIGAWRDCIGQAAALNVVAERWHNQGAGIMGDRAATWATAVFAEVVAMAGSVECPQRGGVEATSDPPLGRCELALHMCVHRLACSDLSAGRSRVYWSRYHEPLSRTRPWHSLIRLTSGE